MVLRILSCHIRSLCLHLYHIFTPNMPFLPRKKFPCFFPPTDRGQQLKSQELQVIIFNETTSEKNYKPQKKKLQLRRDFCTVQLQEN